MRAGIIGCGAVGGALKHYFELNQVEVRLYDPPKGLVDDLVSCDAVFICVPVPTLDDRSQDLTIVLKSIEYLRIIQYSITKPIFIKSSVLPGTCDSLKLGHFDKIYAMPEFLTERTANQDILNHDVLVGGKGFMSFQDKVLVGNLFYENNIHFVTNKEAELAKYTHNAFAAVKVNFFNTIKSLCETLQVNYESVLKGTSITGFIEKTHTRVPGPDGKLGYGGKCLPKDLKALIGLLRENKLYPSADTLEQVEIENTYRRGSFD